MVDGSREGVPFWNENVPFCSKLVEQEFAEGTELEFFYRGFGGLELRRKSHKTETETLDRRSRKVREKVLKSFYHRVGSVAPAPSALDGPSLVRILLALPKGSNHR
jgi:hypothetical protein